ncbi:MAG: cysteine--tRNA ligase [Candidatus Thorarchaeota archaeon]
MKIYNSLTFKKEEFKTIKPNQILMYVCGPTVYDSPHLGHAKSAAVFDLIHRYFKFKGYDVNIVKNYTDIDDKIIKRANELNMDFKALSEMYIKEYEEIMNLLNIEKVTRNPRATEVIDFMIDFIKVLISKGHAYEKNGSVYFSVKSYPKYKTVLQNITKEDIEEEEEESYLLDQDSGFEDEKLDRRDFALWKKAKEGEPYWKSPFGPGRPGWHIECSCMAMKYLGETIDIHGGGQDLKFPHHRNEIAQSESYTGKPFANYFIHNGFVNVDNEKMSKSLGNFFTVSEVVKEFDPMVIRFFLLSSHYRSSINYSLDTMRQAEKSYNRLMNTIKKINELDTIESDSKDIKSLIGAIEKTQNNIIKAMDDDFDTPVAIAELLTLIRELNKKLIEEKTKISEPFKDKFFKFIEDVDKIFGFFPTLKKELKLGYTAELGLDGEIVNNLIEILTYTRNELRKRKIFDLSDDIRKKLKDLGIEIEDKKLK